jgi:hypothetical protein
MAPRHWPLAVPPDLTKAPVETQSIGYADSRLRTAVCCAHSVMAVALLKHSLSVNWPFTTSRVLPLTMSIRWLRGLGYITTKTPWLPAVPTAGRLALCPLAVP